MKPCRSPYCECTPGKCTHPGCYDARHEPVPKPRYKRIINEPGKSGYVEACRQCAAAKNINLCATMPDCIPGGIAYVFIQVNKEQS